MFDALKQHVQSLFVGELVPVKDRCTLTEALVIARCVTMSYMYSIELGIDDVHILCNCSLN